HHRRPVRLLGSGDRRGAVEVRRGRRPPPAGPGRARKRSRDPDGGVVRLRVLRALPGHGTLRVPGYPGELHPADARQGRRYTLARPGLDQAVLQERTNMQARNPAMAARQAALAVIALVALVGSGCSKKLVTQLIPNQAPEVRLTAAPIAKDPARPY